MIDFVSDNKIINEAYRIAVGDIWSNVIDFDCQGEKKPCIMAGLDYDTPWTRDAAINSINAGILLMPEISKNTLLAVCDEVESQYYIGDQYWDKIIWVLAARYYAEIVSDKEFEDFSLKVSLRTIKDLEENEYDVEKGLFRGPAVYGDGIAAYPDKYASVKNNSGILYWVDDNPDLRAMNGYGLPMFALSTNCLYYQVYVTIAKWLEKHGENGSLYMLKAESLKKAINHSFWKEARGSYDYLAGESEAQEGLGLAFAILFGIADSRQTKSILENIYTSEHGIPCVYPNYIRYEKLGEIGRHSGTIWPMVQGFFSLAAYFNGDKQRRDTDLFLMASKAVRDLHFSEIYHPESGLPYGGIQETYTPEGSRMLMWRSMRKQTWSATAFLSIIYYTIIGLKISNDILTVKPNLPVGINKVKVTGIKVRELILDIEIDRDNQNVKEFSIDLKEKGNRLIKLGGT